MRESGTEQVTKNCGVSERKKGEEDIRVSGTDGWSLRVIEKETER